MSFMPCFISDFFRLIDPNLTRKLGPRSRRDRIVTTVKKTDRRKGGDRRNGERRLFPPRPEGRRKNDERRRDDRAVTRGTI